MALDRALEPAVPDGSLTPTIVRPAPGTLEARIGYSFTDAKILDVALTHIGAAKQRNASYQRLEFLGDRVLGLAISAMLFKTFPQAEEGELSRRLADLVRKESCAAVAARWEVELHIRLGAGERSSPTLRQAILGDLCESIIGAVFVDGGFHAASSLVERAFGEQMRAPRRPLRDPKTMLQEWAQAKALATPLYRLVARAGPDHAPAFLVAVSIDGYAEAEAEGSSKRAAEQTAAAAFMTREKLDDAS